MKFSVHLPIKNLKGDQLKTPEGEPATMRHVVTDILLSAQPDDPRDGGAFQFKCFTMAQRFMAQDFLDLTVEELAFIKKRVGNCPNLNHTVIGRVFEIIEGGPFAMTERAAKG